VDCYAVELRKGQKVRVTTFARTLGSSVWPALRVLGVNGKVVVATGEEGSQKPNETVTDPRLDPPPLLFEAAADGRYVVQVERRLGKEGPAAVYRLEIEPFAGSFSLQATTDYLVVPRGGTAVFPVEVKRDGYNGPLELEAESSVPGLQTSIQQVLGPAAARAVVTFTAPAEAPEVAGWFTVTARATIGGREVVQTADLTPVYDAPAGLQPRQGHFFFLRPLPPVVLHRIPLLVTGPPPFTLASTETLLTVRAGGTATVRVHCQRSGGFDGPVSLRVEGLPGNSTAEAPVIAHGTEQAQIRLRVARDLAPGRYSLALVGEAVHGERKRTNAAPPLVVEVK
jgi:hypothetical protein